MKKLKEKKRKRCRRHLRIRKKVHGVSERPRLAVFKSGRHTYCQIIDDDRQVTMAAVSTCEKEIRSELEKTWDIKAADRVGRLIAEKAIQLGVKKLVFDRGGFKYHGRIRAVAEGARAVFKEAGEVGF